MNTEQCPICKNMAHRDAASCPVCGEELRARSTERPAAAENAAKCFECGGSHEPSGARLDCIRHWKRRAIEAENKLNVIAHYGVEGIKPL